MAAFFCRLDQTMVLTTFWPCRVHAGGRSAAGFEVASSEPLSEGGDFKVGRSGDDAALQLLCADVAAVLFQL
jgi:hypothetical protein